MPLKYGKMISESDVCVGVETPVRLSLVREGRQGVIDRVEEGIDERELQPGMSVTIGPGKENGMKWSVFFPEGEEILLNHTTADGIRVRCIETFP